LICNNYKLSKNPEQKKLWIFFVVKYIFKNLVVFGLGSNLNDISKNLEFAIKKLPIKNKKVSSTIQTKALLPKDSPQSWGINYLNTVVIGYPIFDVFKTFSIIKKIEKQMGRTKSKKWAPRIIDIDILFWGDKNISINYLQIPHKELHKRFFTLKPIADIIPFYMHSKYNVNMSKILQNYLRLHAVE
jgi:2-amino-4-hydroxy-6-hydroxymethyldihydropteridine diphosphokinase